MALSPAQVLAAKQTDVGEAPLPAATSGGYTAVMQPGGVIVAVPTPPPTSAPLPPSSPVPTKPPLPPSTPSSGGDVGIPFTGPILVEPAGPMTKPLPPSPGMEQPGATGGAGGGVPSAGTAQAIVNAPPQLPGAANPDGSQTPLSDTGAVPVQAASFGGTAMLVVIGAAVLLSMLGKRRR